MPKLKLNQQISSQARISLSSRGLYFVSGAIFLSVILLAVGLYSVSSTEICGNGIDDDGNGFIDEMGCSCSSGETADSTYVFNQYFAIGQSNTGVTNANNIIGDGDGNYITMNGNNDVIIIELEEEVPAGNQYLIDWFSGGGDAHMIISESTDGITFDYNTTAVTTDIAATAEILTAGVNTRYVRLDINDIDSFGGTTVNGGINSNDGTPFLVDGVIYQFVEFRYKCASTDEICGNGIDDDADGELDESSCVCNTGQSAVPNNESLARYGVGQKNIEVDNASNVLGPPDGNVADFGSNEDILIIDLAQEIPAGDSYTIYWTSQDPNFAHMMISESSDGVNFTYNTTVTTDETTIVPDIITAGVNTRYIRLDKNYFNPIEGINLVGGVASNFTQDYNIDAIVFYSTSQHYSCSPDTDGDTIADLIDLDDDNDGILDQSEQLGFDAMNCSGSTMDFNSPILESGSALQEGAIYRFEDVMTGVDALVEILEIENASVTNIDDTAFGIGEAFQPEIEQHSVNDSGYVDFNIRFVQENTHIDTTLSFLGGGALDIDGEGDPDVEAVGFKDVDYLLVSPFSKLSSRSNDSLIIYYGIPQSESLNSGIDKEVIVFFSKRNASSIFHRTIVFDSGLQEERQFSFLFDPCLVDIFDIPFTTSINTVDSDSDGIVDHLDLDSDNDGIFDAEESGSGATYTNGVLNGAVTSVGIPVQVDANNDSIADYSLNDTDGDGIKNFVDFDSDQDACADVTEAGFDDGDDNGQLDGTGYDANGLVTGFSVGYTNPGGKYLDGTDSTECTSLLPVEWVAFQVEQVGRNAQIFWATSAEQNSDYFQVERSYDRNVFQSLASVQAAGHATELNEYTHMDMEIASSSSRVYYRLKQVDIDGRIDYSNIYELEWDPSNISSSLKIYPNPTTDFLHIEIDYPIQEPISVKVWNPKGQLMESKILKANKHILDVNSWPSGVYFIKVTNSNLPTLKFIKE